MDILNYDPSVTDHEFYQMVKEYIVGHRLLYKDHHTLINIYCALLMPKFTDYVVNKFAEEVQNRANYRNRYCTYVRKLRINS